MEKEIRFFRKDQPYFELSNFAPVGFELDGSYWRTVEHYFQAMKFAGTDLFHRIRDAASPQEAKALGQTRSVPLRPDWTRVKEDIMTAGLRAKFQDPQLQALLLGTGTKTLIEDSPQDNYWGTGPGGTGKNRLGVLLMQVREELRGNV